MSHRPPGRAPTCFRRSSTVLDTFLKTKHVTFSQVSTKYLRVCLFCLGLSHPKRRVVRTVRWRNFARTRVPTMCRTSDICCVLCLRGRRYENNDIFPKMRACRPRLLR